MFEKLCKKIALNIHKPFHRLELVNKEKLTIDSPTIFIVNHQSTSEPMAVYRAIHEYSNSYPKFLAMSGLYKFPVVKNILNGLEFIPVYRNLSKASDSLSKAIEVLNNGENEVVALYPEAELSKDGSLEIRKFKSGAARMALSNSNIKVIPVAQRGSSKGKTQLFTNLIKRPVIKVQFGEPISISEDFYKDKDDYETVNKVTELFKDTVGELYKTL